MTKAAVVLGALLAALLGPPLAAALLLGLVAAPAAGEQLRAVPCPGPLPATGAWRAPFAQPYVLTSGFGPRWHPIDHQRRRHTGQDLVSRPGPGPVLAAAAGRVAYAGTRPFYGNVVDLTHPGGVATRYGHLARIDPAVHTGVAVSMGQQLGVAGSTGASTGNHLHFEVRVHGHHPVDPVPFMREHGAPLNGLPVAATASPRPPAQLEEGGLGFPLPSAGPHRLHSRTQPPTPIPAPVKALYAAAAARYTIPWTLLAGIGMEETGHGRNAATSPAGARGLMQFMPATFAAVGVDGGGDGVARIEDAADSVFSAARYLVRSGAATGPAGVRKALYAYNHADWYVDDVLYYAHAYGGGLVLGDPSDCAAPAGRATGGVDPDLPPLTSRRVAALLRWAAAQVGKRYVFGADGPDAWDCSSFVQAAFAQAGISLPRTAGAQRDWLTRGNGYRVPPGQERPGDLVFWDSYLGPDRIGHVMIVWDPATHTTVEARSPHAGVGRFSYVTGQRHSIFQIWRVGNVADHPAA